MAKIEAPVARPSRPSATLTPFEVEVTISQIQTMNTSTPAVTPNSAVKLSTEPSNHWSRTIETFSDAGVTFTGAPEPACVQGRGNCSASAANTVATST